MTELKIEIIQRRRQQGPVLAPEGVVARLARLHGIRAVVFDVYGTLFSSGVGDISLASEQNRDAALRATLADAGYRLNPDKVEARFDTRFHNWIRQHQEKRREEGIACPEVEIREVWRDFMKELETDGWITASSSGPDLETLAVDYESRINPVQPMPGLLQTLEALKARTCELGIISNAQFFTPLLFDAFLDGGFAGCGFRNEFCVWSYRLLEAKPSVRLYERCAEALKAKAGIEPECVLYIGNDLRNDIRPASQVGFRTALFAGDRLSLRRRQEDPECQGVVADLEITELPQILDCV